MVYVDLNPLRASLVSVPEASADVSIYQRLVESCAAEPEVNHPRLLPFASANSESGTLPYTLKDYLQLLDWTGRARRRDSGARVLLMCRQFCPG